MVGIGDDASMPEHLQAKIAADAEKFFAAKRQSDLAPSSATVAASTEEYQKTFEFEPRKSPWSWLGWAVAGFACIALAVNVYLTRLPGKDIATVTPTPTAVREETATELREKLIASAPDVVRINWGDIDPKKPKNIEGDVVWSNSLQKGYLRFRNIPVNDKSKETYQLWIFDEKQKHPVDGGVFDADKSGEIVIPIDAKIKVEKPTLFAVTAEKPGGVVVSDREVVMAVAKVAA
jgi:anti-sigma-K factor RskA